MSYASCAAQNYSPLGAIRTESECRPSHIESGFNATIHSSIEGHLYRQFSSISAIAQPLTHCSRSLCFRADLVVGANHARGSRGATSRVGLPEGWKNVVRPSRLRFATHLRIRRFSYYNQHHTVMLRSDATQPRLISKHAPHATHCIRAQPRSGPWQTVRPGPASPVPPVLSGRDQASPTSHSLLSHPLRGARCREGIIRLWQ